MLPHSAAARAGLLAGDVIVDVDGQSILTAWALLEQIQQHQPGDTVCLHIQRGTQAMALPVELAADSELGSLSDGLPWETATC